MNVMDVVRKFEKDTGGRVVYLTMSGSKLYGTDTPTSDTDYKGIFIPSRESVLLKQDLDSYSHDTNTSKVKNGADDIDFTVHSIYAFFNQLAKSETGGVDVLFSMFREDTIVLQDKAFTDLIKTHYKSFMNKNMKSFIGYALGQTKKFGIKGARYDELCRVVETMKALSEVSGEPKLVEAFPVLKEFIEVENFKYVKFVMAPGPRGSTGNKEIEYFTVLGKMFAGSITVGHATSRIEKLHGQFGNRTKTIANTTTKTDFKALSHSLRIAQEVQELLETGFISFPLKTADELRDIKSGNADVEETINKVELVLARVDQLLEDTDLPEESDKELMKSLLLSLVV